MTSWNWHNFSRRYDVPIHNLIANMTFKRLPLGLLLTLLLFSSSAQKPKQYQAGQVKQMLKKLNVLGTVLYVAAHPDDENTSLIAYLANDKLYRTAYLSATRGDGGQNLIGPEIREKLGVIRTQELLAARRTDGGQQFFSRANDFGYSKSPDETFNIWSKDEVLSDFVRVFRQFRPDVVITRFSEEPGYTHGHHTASAILAREAFHLSGQTDSYPDQLGTMDVWQPKKLFWNTSWWFYRFRGLEFDTTGLIPMNIGEYNPLLGKTYTEISAESRSMHKSQGFGSTGARGEVFDYLKQLEGEPSKGIFEGIDTSWGRVAGSEEVAEYLQMAQDNYDPEDIGETFQALLLARQSLSKLKDQFWKEIKLKEIDEVLKALTGAYFEIVADDFSYVSGDSMQLKMEAVVRSASGFSLDEVRLDPWDMTLAFDVELGKNRRFNHDLKLQIPDEVYVTHPYWLQKESTLGMYEVPNTEFIGQPENPSTFSATFILECAGQIFEYDVPVVYKRNDPVEGETYRPLAITPPVSAIIDEEVIIFADGTPKSINVKVKSGKANVGGQLALNLPSSWKVTPVEYDFFLEKKNEEKAYTFKITPPSRQEISSLAVKISVDEKVYSKEINIIDYDHIPIQTLIGESSVKLVRLDVNKSGESIGYIEGAGDLIPENLSQLGYSVEVLGQDDVFAENIAKYDAVVLGVRAFNTVPWLAYKNKELFKYIENGGTVIVQYNTNRRLVTEEVAPFPLKISRDRVTVEEAEVRILDKNHPALNEPNEITQKDFEGWVQERGLYFPNEWAEEFIPLLSSNDPGETPKDGGLLVAKYGKGYYVYTGYSWFRELPAGVPGAYRIFVNLLSLGSSSSN